MTIASLFQRQERRTLSLTMMTLDHTLQSKLKRTHFGIGLVMNDYNVVMGFWEALSSQSSKQIHQ